MVERFGRDVIIIGHACKMIYSLQCTIDIFSFKL